MLPRLLLLILVIATFTFGAESNATAPKKSKGGFSFFSKEKEVELPTHAIRIVFEGEHRLSESDVQKALSVDTKSMFEFWKKDDPRIKDKLIPTIPEVLRSYLDSEGYYDATFHVKANKKEIVVTIKEGEPVRVHDINISSDYDLSKFVDFKKGQVFTAKHFIAIKSKIIEALMKDGYCSYDLDTKAYVDLESKEVNLKYALKKGGVCTFGKVTVRGSKTVDDKVVISRVRAREGKRFSTERIQESYDALYALDAFDVVAVKYDRKFYNVVPVDIIVSDISKPWYVMGGVGYDTNVGGRVQADLVRKNFLGNAKKLRLRLQYSVIEQLAEVTLFTPALFGIEDYYLDLFTKVGYSNLEYTGFMEKKGYAQAHLTYTNEQVEINAGFAMENIDISLLDDYDESKLTQAISTGSFFLAYPYAHFVYDGRDSKLNPKYGFYVSADVEYGLPYSEDASAYLKWVLEGRAIYTFGEMTLAAVAKAGVVDETQNRVPESKLFFGGGSYSNRAYGYKRVGVIFTPTRYGIEGADTMANLSLEADYPIIGDLYGAVFTDNTMLTINSYDFTGEILTSAGLGVRYMTPIGPIKVDVAGNVHDLKQYGVQFQIGQSF
jgi:translocation and assembly module TamA